MMVGYIQWEGETAAFRRSGGSSTATQEGHELSTKPTFSQFELSRRQLLLMSSSAILLTSGCSTPPTKPIAPRSFTVDALLASSPFYIAHRGSGDNWTEHSAYAYASALGAGMKAIEISVHATADGVLVCHHDPNTLRMTGKNLTIADQTYSTIALLRSDARQWLGPAAQVQPIPRLKDILDVHAATHIIFLEDKTDSHSRELLDLMDSYPDARQHFVWKQPAISESYSKANAHGYKTWGYFEAGTSGQYQLLVPRFDYVGINTAATDEETSALVGFKKPVIAWEVHNRWMRDRLIRLGVQGMMCSNVLYVPDDSARSRSDTFSTGLRNAGDLPWVIDWGFQPKLQVPSASILVADAANFSYSMGSMCPISAPSYSISFEARWPVQLPPGFGALGIAFGQKSDEPYRVGKPTNVGGYHLLQTVTGQLQLSSRAPGEVLGNQLASLTTAPPRVGEWIKFVVNITSGGLSFTSSNSEPAASMAVPDMTYRGGYFSLCKGYGGPAAVEFRRVSIT